MKGDTKKRIFDIAFSSAALVVAAVPMAALYVATRVTVGHPVMFTHKRLGKDGVMFDMYKFRTMKDSKDNDGHLLPDSERVTRFGDFMRRRGLDELPQILNVLKGNMSIVGPRPLFKHPMLDEYPSMIAKILEVNPGLTSFATVNAIKKMQVLSPLERVDLDVKYVERPVSLRRDLKLTLETFRAFSGGNPQRYNVAPQNENEIDDQSIDLD